MSTQNLGNEVAGKLDRVELLKTVVTLRKEVRSMASDIKSVINENDMLKDKVERLQGQRKGRDHLSEAQRIKQEIDQLVQMHEAASLGRVKPAESVRPQPASVEAPASSSSMLKKMMMFMMISELV